MFSGQTLISLQEIKKSTLNQRVMSSNVRKETYGKEVENVAHGMQDVETDPNPHIVLKANQSETFSEVGYFTLGISESLQCEYLT